MDFIELPEHLLYSSSCLGCHDVGASRDARGQAIIAGKIAERGCIRMLHEGDMIDAAGGVIMPWGAVIAAPNSAHIFSFLRINDLFDWRSAPTFAHLRSPPS